MSQVQIVNLALLKFGDTTIGDINEPSTSAKTAKVFWDACVRRLIRSFPWNFATKQGVLGAPLDTPPLFEYAYAYQLPEDCMRMLAVFPPNMSNTSSFGTGSYWNDVPRHWEIQGRTLLTNLESGFIKYISYSRDGCGSPDSGMWPEEFDNALALMMAAEMASKLGTNGKALRLQLIQEFNAAIAEAKNTDAIEGNRHLTEGCKPLDQQHGSWVETGHGYEYGDTFGMFASEAGGGV
jgi:hypothetical protein